MSDCSSYESMQSIMTMIANDYGYAQQLTLGNSYEGREIRALKVSTGPARDGSPKPQFVVTGGQHSREWISSAAILFMAHTLTADLYWGPMRDDISDIFDGWDFVFVPTLNPDGLEHSFNVDRLWRRTRQPVGQGCFGIDLNRNWAYNFKTPLRPNPCAETWPGTEAFEAPELQGIRDYIQDNNVDAFLDLHSFGQMLLLPWASDCDAVVRDYEDLTEAALGAVKKAQLLHGKKFEVCSVFVGCAAL